MENTQRWSSTRYKHARFKEVKGICLIRDVSHDGAAVRSLTLMASSTADHVFKHYSDEHSTLMGKFTILASNNTLSVVPGTRQGQVYMGSKGLGITIFYCQIYMYISQQYIICILYTYCTCWQNNKNGSLNILV